MNIYNHSILYIDIYVYIQIADIVINYFMNNKHESL